MAKEEAKSGEGKESPPPPPLPGLVYGEIAYWIVVIGMVVGIIGVVMSFTGTNIMDPQDMINSLWAGDDVNEVWQEAAGQESPHGAWYLSNFGKGDVIAMLGIVVMSASAVVGMWASTIVTFIKERDIPYAVMALIVSIILLAAASGIISIQH